MALTPEIRQGLERLKADELRGAAELAVEAARLFGRLLKADRELVRDQALRHLWEDELGVAQSLQELVMEVACAKPAMAPLINLANAMGLAFEGPAKKEGVAVAGLLSARAFVLEWLENKPLEMTTLTDRGLELIPENVTHIFSISHSSTLVQLMLAAQRHGRHWHFHLGEARPGLEGLSTALAALDAGHEVTLTTDDGQPGMMRRYEPGSTTVLVGADTISADSFANKAGTWPLLLAAREVGLPAYIVATTDKFLPDGLQHLHDAKGHPGVFPDEWKVLPRGIDMQNHLFESVPLELVQGLISDHGLLTPAEISDWIGDLPVCSWLKA